jgi:DNA-binding CsgD family transcriptional regulator
MRDGKTSQIVNHEKRLIEPLTAREQEVLLLLNQHLRYQDIAEQLHLALSSVKWFVQQIYGKLGVNNRRAALLRAQELGLLEIEGNTSPSPEDFPSITTNEARRSNLPVHLTSFIGREKELSEVHRLLETSRLVTLTGSGGTGKTRLSLRAARQAVKRLSGWGLAG